MKTKAPARKTRTGARNGARNGAQAAPSARGDGDGGSEVVVRSVRRGDLAAVVAIDARVTGLEKKSYWQSVFRRYGAEEGSGRSFLVADSGGDVAGFIIGEVRDWEFGAPPCGWVFAIDVRPDARLSGVGTRLLEAICAAFRRAGVRKVRTILARDNHLILSFFRSQGMMTGPFIPLEMDLEP